jgi:hypothetical protein
MLFKFLNNRLRVIIISIINAAQDMGGYSAMCGNILFAMQINQSITNPIANLISVKTSLF